MISYRLVRASDWPAIKLLVNQVFQETVSMEKSFPLLLNPSNTFSYVALDNQRIIGFIGVIPEELSTQQQSFYGSRVGAVCIAKAYQGQGIGRSLFRKMKSAAEYDFILVSGQGNLYIQEGCELFGEFLQFVVPGKMIGLKVTEYNGELSQLLKVHQLLQTKECFFKQSLAHLQQLIASHALANLWTGKQNIFLAKDESGKEACLVTCTRHEANITITEVLEQGGDTQLITQMAQELATRLPNLTIRTPIDSALAQDFKKISDDVSVKNAGTILYLNEKIKEVSIPHTWDLAFL